MIVRLMGEGQFRASDDLLGQLNALDEQAQAAADAGNEPSSTASSTRCGTWCRPRGSAWPTTT